MNQAFYIAGSGLKAQQENMDIISNNIANINTPGYKPKRTEFSELLNMQLSQNQASVVTPFGAKASVVSKSGEMIDYTQEISNLIQSQMAYRYNSQVMKVADEVEGMANHLRY